MFFLYEGLAILMFLIGILLMIAGTDCDTSIPFIFGFLMLIAGLILSMILPVNAISRHMSAESCHNWSVQNQRPSKFATYTYWNWDCLTKTADGHWISTTAYNAYINGQVGKP